MSNNSSCMTCGSSGGLCGGKALVTLKEGVWTSNPLAIQVLGICSALAVTNKLSNSLVMGAALLFMVAEVAIIATFVILFDQFLRAYYWEMSKQLGPYVGLIITNCIVMGRAEAFALQNPPLVSMVDGVANGIGYGVALAIIGFARELFGSGQVAFFGMTINLGDWYTPNQLMILAPGAFFVFGVLIAIFNVLKGSDAEEDKK
ncbi:MAG: Rnf-Nqr domain containing protein [Planctomycetota bacterium]